MVLPLPLSSISLVDTSQQHEHVIDDDQDPCGDCFCPKQTLAPGTQRIKSQLLHGWVSLYITWSI